MIFNKLTKVSGGLVALYVSGNYIVFINAKGINKASANSQGLIKLISAIK